MPACPSALPNSCTGSALRLALLRGVRRLPAMRGQPLVKEVRSFSAQLFKQEFQDLPRSESSLISLFSNTPHPIYQKIVGSTFKLNSVPTTSHLLHCHHPTTTHPHFTWITGVIWLVSCPHYSNLSDILQMKVRSCLCSEPSNGSPSPRVKANDLWGHADLAPL